VICAYEYLRLSLPRGPARQAFVSHLAGARKALAGAGGEVLGLFTAQLGWEAAQAALLLRWRTAAADDSARGTLLSAPQVLSEVPEPLSPTARPADEARLQPGGIHVHRWFETAASDLDEFLRLSQEGWKDFEPRFDARVFGLFLADESVEDRRSASRRLLLITRYAGHGVWEASRDPSTEAMRSFARRAQLTLRTHAASTLLTPF
jgi:hypothetical protein